MESMQISHAADHKKKTLREWNFEFQYDKIQYNIIQGNVIQYYPMVLVFFLIIIPYNIAC